MIYRRGRRRRYRSITSSDYNHGILLSDFIFFNNTKKIIDENIFIDIKKKLQDEDIKKMYWTNDTFANANVYFKMYKKDRKVNKEDVEDIYITIVEGDRKFETEDILKCHEIIDNIFYLQFKPSDDFHSFLNYIDIGYSRKRGLLDKEINFFKNEQEVINFLIENKILNYIDRNSDWDDFMEDINNLFGKNTLTEEDKPEIVENNENNHINVELITKVIEKRINEKNYRIAMCAAIESYYNKYYIDVIDDEDKNYIRYDEGRVFFNINGDNYFIGDGIIEKNEDKKYIINKTIIRALKKNVHSVLAEGENVISPRIYNFYKDRVSTFVAYSTTDIINEREQKINEQYQKLLRQGRTIRFNDMQISYENEMYKIQLFNGEFTLECTNNFLNFDNDFNNIKKILDIKNAQYNYNTLWENLIGISKIRYLNTDNNRTHSKDRFKETEFTINGMNIKIERKNNRLKINDIFCRVGDIVHVLNRLICFNDVDEYNKYLKEVSYIGIEWKQLISSGILIQLNNPFFNVIKRLEEDYTQKSFYMRFSLQWDSEKRNNIYLILNHQKYLIRYKGKFKRYFNSPTKNTTMIKLKTELQECIDSITDDKIIEIVTNAIEEAKIIQKRGEDLVIQTIKDIKAVDAVEEINGSKKNGYLIIGKKTKTKYFIDKVSLGVYKWINGEWNHRCVASAYGKERIFEDRLANRLVNIYNEPTYIHTI